MNTKKQFPKWKVVHFNPKTHEKWKTNAIFDQKTTSLLKDILHFMLEAENLLCGDKSPLHVNNRLFGITVSS